MYYGETETPHPIPLPMGEGAGRVGRAVVVQSRRICPSPAVRRTAAALAAGTASAWLATPANAHGFGQRYDLPIPLSFYLFGTAAAVVVTFVIVGLFVREGSRSHVPTRVDLLATPLGRLIAGPAPV